MYILIISLVCALMLGGVYIMAYDDVANAVLVTFLLFISIDTGLRALLDKPSWIVGMISKKDM